MTPRTVSAARILTKFVKQQIKERLVRTLAA
jgi:hypothetical protein